MLIILASWWFVFGLIPGLFFFLSLLFLGHWLGLCFFNLFCRSWLLLSWLGRFVLGSYGVSDCWSSWFNSQWCDQRGMRRCWMMWVSTVWILVWFSNFLSSGLRWNVLDWVGSLWVGVCFSGCGLQQFATLFTWTKKEILMFLF